MSQEQTNKKNKVILIVSLAVICVAIIIFAVYKVNAQNAYEEKTAEYQTQFNTQLEEINQLKADIQALTAESYLKADINKEEIKVVADRLY